MDGPLRTLGAELALRCSFRIVDVEPSTNIGFVRCRQYRTSRRSPRLQTLGNFHHGETFGSRSRTFPAADFTALIRHAVLRFGGPPRTAETRRILTASQRLQPLLALQAPLVLQALSQEVASQQQSPRFSHLL